MSARSRFAFSAAAGALIDASDPEDVRVLHQRSQDGKSTTTAGAPSESFTGGKTPTNETSQGDDASQSEQRKRKKDSSDDRKKKKKKKKKSKRRKTGRVATGHRDDRMLLF